MVLFHMTSILKYSFNKLLQPYLLDIQLTYGYIIELHISMQVRNELEKYWPVLRKELKVMQPEPPPPPSFLAEVNHLAL